jgi:abortive infection bacteriophage resistance protein
MGRILYSKKALSIAEQLALLESRGVIIEDKAFAQHVLSTVTYYRFSAYLYPFR